MKVLALGRQVGYSVGVRQADNSIGLANQIKRNLYCEIAAEKPYLKEGVAAESITV